MLRPYTEFGSYVLYIPGLNQPTNQAYKLMKLEFNKTNATDVWLYIFSGTAIPANGTAPIVAPILCQGNFSGVETLLPDGLTAPAPGIVIVASSTAGTFTADATATIDMTAYVEEFEIQPSGASTAGDYTTARNSLQVWTEATGPKSLIKLELTNSDAVINYAVVYALDTPHVTSKPIAILPIPAKVGGVNGQAIFSFGNVQGVSPYQKDPDATVHQGCTVWVSTITTPGSINGGTPATIKATYK